MVVNPMVPGDLKSYTKITNCSPNYKCGCPPHSSGDLKSCFQVTGEVQGDTVGGGTMLQA